MNTSTSRLCRLCDMHEETLEHLFVWCPHVKDLWTKLSSSTLGTDIESVTTNPVDILLGTWEKSKNCLALNTIYLITKHYIFRCAKKCQKPNVKSLQYYMKSFYDEHQYLAKINNREKAFRRQWTLASHLINLV